MIELLVVISIIALLISILLPALQAARQAGQAASCMSNIRQLFLGVQLYSNNNREWLPVNGHQSDVATWAGVVARELELRYVTEASKNTLYAPGLITYSLTETSRNNGIFQCPTETGKFTNAWGGQNATSYGWNTKVFYPGSSGYGLGTYTSNTTHLTADIYRRVRSYEVVKPSNTIVLADKITQNNTFEYQWWGVPDTTGNIATYHSGGANVAWADGHASAVKNENLTSDDFDRRF